MLYFATIFFSSSLPPQLYYNTSAYLSEGFTHESQIGPQVVHMYAIRNKGPSNILEAEAYFLWPSRTLDGICSAICICITMWTIPCFCMLRRRDPSLFAGATRDERPHQVRVCTERCQRAASHGKAHLFSTIRPPQWPAFSHARSVPIENSSRWATRWHRKMSFTCYAKNADFGAR